MKPGDRAWWRPSYAFELEVTVLAIRGSQVLVHVLSRVYVRQVYWAKLKRLRLLQS